MYKSRFDKLMREDWREVSEAELEEAAEEARAYLEYVDETFADKEVN